MTDIIMRIGVVCFFILFLFLFFLFCVFLCSLFIKRKVYSDFTPGVSVVIPAYNEQSTISNCIRSVKASNYPNHLLDIIVVDDGSTDNTVALAQQEKVRVVKCDHKGKPDALNSGVLAARHDIVVTLDADTTVHTHFIRNIVAPFKDKRIAIASGAMRVANPYSLLGLFQRVEYLYNNMILRNFVRVFNTGVWFFGCLSCYRVSALKKVGLFTKDTVCEDMEISLALKKAGYKTMNVMDAIGYTIVPLTLIGLFRQRSRWWIGGFQSLVKHKEMFWRVRNGAIQFIFINHIWWGIYALVSFPLIVYQVWYWFPPQGISEAAAYLFRWFSLSGPVYVLYMIPEWGLSFYNIFGVTAGILTAIMIIASLIIYKETRIFGNLFVVFFYFPYTIILNMIIAVSVFKLFGKNKYFIKT